VISKKEELLESEPEMSTIHLILNHLDMETIDLESVITEALRMYDGFPPKLLWKRGKNRVSCVTSFSANFEHAVNLRAGIMASQRQQIQGHGAKRKKKVSAVHIGMIIATAMVLYTWFQGGGV
jgi:hypothetical protein